MFKKNEEGELEKKTQGKKKDNASANQIAVSNNSNGLNIKSLLLKVSTPMEKEYMGKSSSNHGGGAHNVNHSSDDDRNPSDPA